MKPSELQAMSLKQIRLALPVKSKGAEHAIADMLTFCRECNRDRFHFIPIVKLIRHFYVTTSGQDREQVSTKIKIEGLNMLLEESLVIKSTRQHLRFSKALKKSLAKQYFNPVIPQKSESSLESKSMTATTSG